MQYKVPSRHTNGKHIYSAVVAQNVDDDSFSGTVDDDC